MVKKHESSNVVIRIPDEFFFNFFSESMKAVLKLDALYHILEEYENDESDEDDVFDALDELNLQYSAISALTEYHPSIEESYNKYLKRTGDTLKIFCQNVQMIVNNGIYPSDGDIEILKSEIYSVIGGLSYFIVSDFNIAGSYDEWERTGKFDIDEIVDSYLKANNLSISDCNVILDMYSNYRLHFDFFDEYPELEAPFEAAAGPGYNLIPEGMLNLDIVAKIISGEISIDDLLEQITGEDEC